MCHPFIPRAATLSRYLGRVQGVTLKVIAVSAAVIALALVAIAGVQVYELFERETSADAARRDARTACALLEQSDGVSPEEMREGLALAVEAADQSHRWSPLERFFSSGVLADEFGGPTDAEYQEASRACAGLG